MYLANFEKELLALNSKYTLDYLFAIDEKLAEKAQVDKAFTAAVSACDFDVVFTRKTLDNLLVCEVVPKGDRMFTITQVYLFKIEKKRICFIAQKTINYN